MVDLISSKQVALDVRARSWQEAVRRAGQLLVNSGAAEPSYIEAMVHACYELGPYFVITPGIAIPHARPEDGACQVGFSVLRLDPPVVFGSPDHDPVTLVVAFCSSDAVSHVVLFARLARRVGKEGFLEQVRAAQTPEELAGLLNE